MKSVTYSLAGALIVVGVVVAIASFFSPGQVIHGIDAGLAGILIAGGAVTFALAGLTEAVETFGQTLLRTLRLVEGRAGSSAESAVAPVARGPEETLTPFAATSRAETEQQPLGDTTAAAAHTPAQEDAPAAPESVAESLAETPSASLRDAVEEAAPEPIVETLTVVEEIAVAEAPTPSAPESEAEAPADELYVVEEREFRGKPARVLSDGTVEAETDEGWMRFENMEHLEEYMDAMEAQRR